MQLQGLIYFCIVYFKVFQGCQILSENERLKNGYLNHSKAFIILLFAFALSSECRKCHCLSSHFDTKLPLLQTSCISACLVRLLCII